MKNLTIFMFIFVIMKEACAQSEYYRILPLSELNEIYDTRKNDIDTSYTIEYNAAYAVIFRDGTAMLRPPIYNSEGFYFENVDVMKKMIDSRIYPIKGTGGFWEKEKERVIYFANYIDFYCNKLSNLIGFTVSFNDDSQYLIELSKSINKILKQKNIDKEIFYYISIYVGEMLRRKSHSEWKLNIQYSFNLFYLPELVKNNTYCNHWNFLKNQLEMAAFRPINIEQLIDQSNEFFIINGRQYFIPLK